MAKNDFYDMFEDPDIVAPLTLPFDDTLRNWVDRPVALLEFEYWDSGAYGDSVVLTLADIGQDFTLGEATRVVASHKAVLNFAREYEKINHTTKPRKPVALEFVWIQSQKGYRYIKPQRITPGK